MSVRVVVPQRNIFVHYHNISSNVGAHTLLLQRNSALLQIVLIAIPQ